MPSLAVLTPDFPPALGGIQRYLGRITEELTHHGWDVTVLAPRIGRGGGLQPPREVNVVRMRMPWNGAKAAAVLAEMAIRLRRLEADVVLFGHVVTLPAGRGVQGPSACVCYGSELWGPWGRRALTAHLDQLQRVIAISRFTASEAISLGVPPERVSFVSPAADVETPPRDAGALQRYGLVDTAGGTAPYLICVARLGETHKGHEQLIRAFPAIAARIPGVRLVIAGEGGLRARFERIASAGPTSRIVWTGRLDDTDKATLLANARAFVMLSREAFGAGQFEGFGIAYLEAALLGTPSLAGRGGGVPDAVIDGETGILVNPDDPVEIVAGALRLLEDPSYARCLGDAALARAESMTWERAGACMHNILRGLS